MTRETILKPIGNWQITIPLLRRQYLNIDKKHVKAKLEGNHIIIEPLEKEAFERDIKQISLNKTKTATQKTVKQSHKDYQAGKKESFMSHETARHAL